MNTRYAIVLLGAQASGKGTQAQLLSEQFGIPVLSPGAVFRRISQEDSERGRLVARYLTSGELLPLSVSDPIVFQELADKKYDYGVIIDGYPRTREQASYLESMIPVRYVIALHISDTEAIARITNRRSCSCGAVYNLITNPPRREGICDRCGKKLVIRDDDQPDAIRRRLEIFHTQTEGVLRHYYEQGILIEVNGMEDVETVFMNIMRGIEEKQRAKGIT